MQVKIGSAATTHRKIDHSISLGHRNRELEVAEACLHHPIVLPARLGVVLPAWRELHGRAAWKEAPSHPTGSQ